MVIVKQGDVSEYRRLYEDVELCFSAVLLRLSEYGAEHWDTGCVRKTTGGIVCQVLLNATEQNHISVLDPYDGGEAALGDSRWGIFVVLRAGVGELILAEIDREGDCAVATHVRCDVEDKVRLDVLPQIGLRLQGVLRAYDVHLTFLVVFHLAALQYGLVTVQSGKPRRGTERNPAALLKELEVGIKELRDLSKID